MTNFSISILSQMSVVLRECDYASYTYAVVVPYTPWVQRGFKQRKLRNKRYLGSEKVGIELNGIETHTDT